MCFHGVMIQVGKAGNIGEKRVSQSKCSSYNLGYMITIKKKR